MFRLSCTLLAIVFAVGVARGATPKTPSPVLVVSDVFTEVPDSLRPQPGKPVTYAIAGKYESNIGAPMAGEPRADAADVEAEVIKVLASQGFVKTEVGGPLPGIALLITWGSAVLDMSEMSLAPLPGRIGPVATDPNDPTDPTRPPDTQMVAMNQRQISLLVGADKASASAMDPNALAQINEAAGSNRVYVFIVAYDMEAMAQRKEKKMLWRTRISIPSTRHSLPDSLGVMLTSAGPFLGREVAAPVIIGEADRRKTDVKVGMPYVVPDAAKTDTGKKAK